MKVIKISTFGIAGMGNFSLDSYVCMCVCVRNCRNGNTEIEQSYPDAHQSPPVATTVKRVNLAEPGFGRLRASTGPSSVWERFVRSRPGRDDKSSRPEHVHTFDSDIAGIIT